MGESEWLSASAFAEAASFSPQAARKALRSASEGKAWHGAVLRVRVLTGRGGRGGLSYEVARHSLPADLQLPLKAPLEAPKRPLTPRFTADNQDATVQARWRVIEPIALATEAGDTLCKAAMIAEAAESAGVSARTISRWLAEFERRGWDGLARRKPSNAGQARTYVSRPFDKAFLAKGGAPELLAQIGADMDAKIASIWRSRAETGGWTNVRQFAEHELRKMVREAGVTVPKAATCLSRRHIERFAHHRIVNTYNNDRKRFEDGKPRIQRDWTCLAPMECVIADVKHVDVVLQRPDGSEVWPKIVGFHDGGTGRVFVYPVLLARGEGVRQQHIVEAFMEMVADPMWGFPNSLYLDNGSEFGVFERIRSALQLVSAREGRELTFAKPYNASAKPVENTFKRLDSYLFSLLPGYAGSDRMNKKTQKVGRKTKPYPGTWEDFCATLKGMLIAFNARPVGGQWGNRSADDWTMEKQAQGWRSIRIDPLVLDSAFCTTEERTLNRGKVSIEGRAYVHPALDELPQRSKVTVAMPWRRGAPPLFRLPSGEWAYAEPDLALPADWTEGAKEAGRRQRRHERGVKALGAADFDPVAATLEMAADYQPPSASGCGSQLDGGSQLTALADGRAKAEQNRRQELTEKERLKIMRDRHTAALLRNQANVA